MARGTTDYRNKWAVSKWSQDNMGNYTELFPNEPQVTDILNCLKMVRRQRG